MNVIFTCGGTGGHIIPAIAVADILKERRPDSKILFIGGENNMEDELVPKAGYPLVNLSTSCFARGKSIASLRHNIRAVKRIWRSVQKCKKVIRDFDADVIVGTGGYASFPALMAGTLLKVPTCVHESNAMPGLTTRLIANRVDRVLVCFPESVKYYRSPKNVEVVGMPVRREFIYTDKEKARQELSLDARPLIVSAFGSQGAKAMNEMVAELFALEKADGYPFRHIHAVGSYGWEWMPEYVRRKGIDLGEDKGIVMKEYLHNMPTVVAAADVVISRAGASSCNEIAASGTPCVLIPSPNVTDNHQEKNARALAEGGGAVLMLEKDCSAQKLYEEITTLLKDKERYSRMQKALQKMVVPDSAERLCDILIQLATKE